MALVNGPPLNAGRHSLDKLSRECEEDVAAGRITQAEHDNLRALVREVRERIERRHSGR